MLRPLQALHGAVLKLSELAALAAEKVPGFVRPDGGRCSRCKGTTKIRIGNCPVCRESSHSRMCPGFDLPPNDPCGCGTGRVHDDSPAALRMAVDLWAMSEACKLKGSWRGVVLQAEDRHGGRYPGYALVSTGRDYGEGEAEIATPATPEAIAEAVLRALLAAHEVEVPA